MPLSYENYTGDNTTTQFSIPFTYQDTAEISVTVDGVAETGLTFPSSSTVQLTSAPATNTLVQVRRTTDLAARAIDFASGSVLTEEDLDDSAIQVFHAAQESVDRALDSIALGNDNKWDAGGNVIKNVGTPTANTDAATKLYADGISSAAVTQATSAAVSAANAAGTTATANLIPDATKLAIHPIGSQYTLSDGTTTDYSAKHYQDLAATSGTSAATSATNAATSETNAEDWAIKIDGIVDATGYSAKAWSIGGDGVTDTAGAGPAKDWATETTTNVDGTEFSAKEYAIGSQAGNAEGSAKQWAIGGGAGYNTSVTVDGTNYSAKYWAEQAKNEVQTQRDVYYGAFVDDTAAETYQTDPAPTGNGGTVDRGDLYFNTTNTVMRVYNGASWDDVAVSTTNVASNGFAIAMAIAL